MSITLHQKTASGEPLQALFLPEHGMMLTSLKKGDSAVINVDTGVGLIIGPHFASRSPAILPQIKETPSLSHDPFDQGIGRYASWKVEGSPSENRVKAIITGKEQKEGIPLSSFEGQNFKMTYEAQLHPSGLHLDLSVVSETDSLIGTEFRFALPDGPSLVSSDVKKNVYEQGVLKTLSDENSYHEGKWTHDLSKPIHAAFHPLHTSLSGTIHLTTAKYRLEVRYRCINQEHSWVLHKQPDKSFVSISPVTSQNPWKPNLTASSIHIECELL